MTLAKPTLQSRSEGTQFSFGPFCLRADGTLFRGSDTIPLPPKELTALQLLLNGSGRIVPSEQLKSGIWGEVNVSADSLPRCISSLRAHLGSQDCILTVYKHGYRLNFPVEITRISGKQNQESIERRNHHISGLPRLVILPFNSGSGVPEPFGAGIAEETMMRLGRSSNPVVEILAQHSVSALAARGLPPHEIAKTLQADLLLMGTIVALPMHFRLRAEMIRLADGVQLWIEDFMLPHTMLAYLDARLAKRITARIRDSFTSSAMSLTRRTPATSLQLGTHAGSESNENKHVKQINEADRSEAYSLYLHARENWKSLGRRQMDAALEGLERAVALDPSLVSARIHLMQAYLAHASFGYMRADIAAERARKEAELAIPLLSRGLSIYPALGWIHFHHDRDLDAALQAFTRSEPGIDSGNPWSQVHRVKFLLGRGRYTEAIDLLRGAIRTDAYSPWMHGRLIWALHLSGDRQAAVEQGRHAVNLFPDHPLVLNFAATVFAAHGSVGDPLTIQAVALARQLTFNSPDLDQGFSTLAYALARQGSTKEARAVIERQQWLSLERFVMGTFLAPALVELGDLHGALDVLTLAEQQHCPWLFEVLADPRLHPLHGKGQFKQLSSIHRQMGLSSYSVA